MPAKISNYAQKLAVVAVAIEDLQIRDEEDRVATFDKFEGLQAAVTVMEKVKVMIEYPESALATDRDLKRHLWDQLQQLYKVKK